MQALRAIAALFVVVFHATVLRHDLARPALPFVWENGNSGVDLFFVISGFIMVISSRRLRLQPGGWARFIKLRLVRVVPLYWIATAAKLLAIGAVPEAALHTRPTAWNTLASLLFIPSRDATGAVRPVVVVGWTLSFEMLFYLVFAAALLLSLDPIVVVAPVMVALAVLSDARTGAWPAVTSLADPIVIEFVFGLLVGQLFVSRGPLKAPPWLAFVAGAVALAGLALLPAEVGWQRVCAWGVAATGLLWAALAMESWAGVFVPGLLVAIGEASYSLYLAHGFVLPVVGMVVERLHLPAPLLGMVLVPASVVASVAFSLLVYRYVEVPVTNWLRQITGDRRPTCLAAPQTPI